MAMKNLWIEIGKRRWLKKILWTHLPSIAELQLQEIDLKLYVDLKDFRGPSFYMMYGGPGAFERYENPEKTLIVSQLPENGVFIDIGANIGLFSFFVHKMRAQAQIYAFEPHPVLFECLSKTLTENRLEKQMKCMPLGLSHTPQKVQLYLDETDSGGHSLDAQSFSRNVSAPKSVWVDVTTLDTFVDREKLNRIDVIKIDVQGLENEVLKGSKALIQKYKPDFLIECDNLRLKNDATYLLEHLESPTSYRWKPLEDQGTFRSLQGLKGFADLEIAAGKPQSNYFFSARL
jgi:FkbM family methyltransferase